MAITRMAIGLVVGLCHVACGASTSSPTAPTNPSTAPAFTLVAASVNPSILPPGDTAIARVQGWTTLNGASIYGPVLIPITTRTLYLAIP